MFWGTFYRMVQGRYTDHGTAEDIESMSYCYIQKRKAQLCAQSTERVVRFCVIHGHFSYRSARALLRF